MKSFNMKTLLNVFDYLIIPFFQKLIDLTDTQFDLEFEIAWFVLKFWHKHPKLMA